jgi:hypothetical protein
LNFIEHSQVDGARFVSDVLKNPNRHTAARAGLTSRSKLAADESDSAESVDFTAIAFSPIDLLERDAGGHLGGSSFFLSLNLMASQAKPRDNLCPFAMLHRHNVIAA